MTTGSLCSWRCTTLKNNYTISYNYVNPMKVNIKMNETQNYMLEIWSAADQKKNKQQQQ